jgi:hypothetical protein
MPNEFSRVWISAKHPRYRHPALDTVATLGRDGGIVLKQGLRVAGRVVDADGRPSVCLPIGPKSGQSWLAAD